MNTDNKLVCEKYRERKSGDICKSEEDNTRESILQATEQIFRRYSWRNPCITAVFTPQEESPANTCLVAANAVIYLYVCKNTF